MHWRRNGQSREQNKQKKKHWKILISWPEANKNKAKSFQSAVIYYPLTEKKTLLSHGVPMQSSSQEESLVVIQAFQALVELPSISQNSSAFFLS